MRTIPVALATHYALTSNTIAYALKITRTDDEVFGFTSHDQNVTISSVPYLANPGFDPSSLVTSASFNVDNLELSTIHDGTVFTTLEVLSGVWRNAAFEIFKYNWASPSDGVDVVVAGTFGEVELRRNKVIAELRGLQQYLQQQVGIVSQKACRARLGDSLCTKDLTAFRHSGTVTTAGQQTFTDSGMAQAANYFTEGEVEWLTGANAGLHAKVKAHATGGVFTLALAMLGTVTIGDTFEATAGCTKRLVEDCFAKFDNVINFQGEPHRPTINDLSKPAEPSV